MPFIYWVDIKTALSSNSKQLLSYTKKKYAKKYLFFTAPGSPNTARISKEI